MNKLESEDFRPLFGTWFEHMKPFIESEAMFDIYAKLKAERDIILPDSSLTFRTFAATNYDSVKCVWILQDPYAKRYKGGKIDQATGIPMDCSNTPDGRLQPSLDIFYDALTRDMGKKVMRSPSLEYLSEQGVLLLNSDYTVRLNKTGSHEGVWVAFQKYLFEEVMSKKTNMIYVLAGKTSQTLKRYINPLGNYLFEVEHPASAAYRNGDWNDKDIFNKINKLLKEKNEHIFWDKKDVLKKESSLQ